MDLGVIVCVSELWKLHTGSFRSAELCVGISCLLAKSEPQNHSPPGSLSLRHKQPQRQADGGPILFRTISSPPLSQLNNTYSPLLPHEKLLIPYLGISHYSLHYMLNSFYDLNFYKTKFITIKRMYIYWCEKQTHLLVLNLEKF